MKHGMKRMILSLAAALLCTMLLAAAVTASAADRVIYIADNGNKRILVIDTEGNFIREIVDKKNMKSPMGVFVDDDLNEGRHRPAGLPHRGGDRSLDAEHRVG